MNPHVPEGYTIPADDIALLAECDVSVFRASGPGGQSVNTADSAVRLVHRPTGLRVVSREHRSQLLNKRAATRRLRSHLERMTAPPPPPRHPTKATRSAVQRRLSSKSARSTLKVTRRTPRDED